MNKNLKELLLYSAVVISMWFLPLLSIPLFPILCPEPVGHLDFLVVGFAFFILSAFAIIILFIATIIAMKKAKSKPLRTFLDNVWLSVILLLSSITSFALTFFYQDYDLQYYIFPICYILGFFVFVSLLFIKNMEKPFIFSLLAFIFFAFIPIIANSFFEIIAFFLYLILIPCILISSTVLLCHFFKFIKAKLKK